MEAEIVRGDPVLRRRLLLLLPLVLVLGSLVLAVTPHATRFVVASLYGSPDGRKRAVPAMLAFAAPFTLLAWIVAASAVRRSLQTLRARRFPPPGMRVVRDTPVLHGRVARLFGMVGLVLGVALLTAGTVLPVVAYRIGVVLRDGCPRAAAPVSPGVGDQR